MATIKFTYQGKTKEIYQNNSFIEDYSEDPEALGRIIRELESLTCNLVLAHAPWGGKPRIMGHKHTPWDAKPYIKSDARIGYQGRILRFDFYHSLADSRDFLADHKWVSSDGQPRIKARGLDSEWLKDTLYSLLCTIRCEAGVHELRFREFCDEFGYDEDSRKAYSLYERCCDFSRDIARVFSSQEIESFPS